MFESLTRKLSDVFDRLRGRGALSEEDVDSVLREIRLVLLDADVAIPAVKALLVHVKQKLVGQDVLRSLSPTQVITKAVHSALIEFLGEDVVPLKTRAKSPFSYVFVGLQGAGKTTSVAKVARHLKESQHLLLVSLDVTRPAAREQLCVLGESLGVPVFQGGEVPLEIVQKALLFAKKNDIDLILWDTAGRLHVDEELMAELAALHGAIQPVETLLVADAMMGQEAVHVAQTFHEVTPLTGILLTRVDGDMRGGAALSLRFATGCPIKFLGTGEGVDKLIPFEARRLADQILDQGDLIEFVERAQKAVSQNEMQRMERRLAKGQFTLNDMVIYLKKMQNMGGFFGLLQSLPGAQKMTLEASQRGLDKEKADRDLRRNIALIQSMTPRERSHPESLNGSRRKRIAAGAGQTVAELNRLLKQYEQIRLLTKKFSKNPLGLRKILSSFPKG